MPLSQETPASFASHRSMPQGERLSSPPASTTDRTDDSTVDNKPKADFVHHVSDIVDHLAGRPIPGEGKEKPNWVDRPANQNEEPHRFE